MRSSLKTASVKHSSLSAALTYLISYLPTRHDHETALLPILPGTVRDIANKNGVRPGPGVGRRL